MQISCCAWSLVLLVLILFIAYVWKKRWVIYYGFQFSGPSAIAVTGIVLKMIQSSNEVPKILQKVCETQPPIFKMWIASELYIINSQPEDIEVLMTLYLEKNYPYKIWDEFINNSVLTSPVSVWKPRRREMNRTFNPKILASFHDVFVKHAKETVKTFEKLCGTEQTELLFGVWKHNLDAALETLMGINPASIDGLYGAITAVIRAEKIVVERLTKFWLLIDLVFRFSKLHKEVKTISGIAEAIGRKIVNTKKEQISTDDLNQNGFLSHMIDWSKNGNKMTESEMVQETVMMATAASETTSLTIVSVILTLGLMSDVQDKVYQEISAVLTDNEDPTIEDINRMDYLERVIKETLRILPIVPFVLRSIDKTTKIGSFVYPAGSNMAIPFAHVHRRPDIWPDPLKFDPDRFLPGEVAKRHRCAYLPFSFGPRNCIGPKYGMMSMKVVLAYIVKNFEIKALNYRSLEDLEFDWHILTKVKGYRVMFERRTSFTS